MDQMSKATLLSMCRQVSFVFLILAVTYLGTACDGVKESLRMYRPEKIHGQVLVVQEGLNRVVIFPKEHSEDRTMINVGEMPHEIEMSADSRTAYVSNFGMLEANHKVGTPGTTISVINVAEKRERTRFTLPVGAHAPHGLKIRPQHSNELFTNAEDGIEEMVVFNAESGAVLRTFPLPKAVHNFIFSADGAVCYAFTTGDGIFRLDADNGRILAKATIPQVRGLVWTGDHTHIVVGARGQVLLLKPQDLTVTRIFADLSVGQVFYPAASPDGATLLAPAVVDGVLLVIDERTGEVRKRIATGSPLQAVLDGKYAWVSNVKVPKSVLPSGETERPGGLVRVDLSTFQIQTIRNTQDANGIAVIP